MIDSTNICLACGCCCDGTLIGFVQVEAEEKTRLRELLDLEDLNGGGFFLQPCKRFCGGCTIYSQRPQRCASFNCGLLQSVESGEVAFGTAVEIVNIVKEKRVSIEEKLAKLQLKLKSASFYFKMVELKNMFGRVAGAHLPQDQLDLKAEVEQLERLLSQHFDLSFA